mmetsp:Transcript_15964/g.23668  ORF Transcript_15964/g.23668 Transcript_15964/m.23668 type:complete len:83 (+) Transcript_15964:150-398(+)
MLGQCLKSHQKTKCNYQKFNSLNLKSSACERYTSTPSQCFDALYTSRHTIILTKLYHAWPMSEILPKDKIQISLLQNPQPEM